MTNRAAARRYARALFDVLQQQGKDGAAIERAETDLKTLADLVSGVPALAAALGNPAIPVQKKRGVAQAILDRAGMTGPVAKLVTLLADRDRLMLLPEMAATYRERVLDWKNIVQGELTTAVPVASGTVRDLERRLSQVTGRTVTLDAKVDPSIVGGAVTRLGSIVYDGSVTTQLQRLKESLVETAQ